MNKTRNDVIVNIVFSILKAVAVFLCIRIAGVVYTPAYLGLFLLIRRTAGIGASILQMGTSQTLLRYIAINKERSKEKSLYFSFALLVVFLVSVLLIIFAAIFPSYFSTLFLPEFSGASDIVFWIAGLVIVMMLDYIVRAFFIAERNTLLANSIELLTGNGFLLLAFLVWARNATIELTLEFQVIAMFALLAVLVLLIQTRNANRIRCLGDFFPSVTGSFFRYGLPRGIIPILDMLFLTMGPWLLRNSPEESGFLLISFSVVNMFLIFIGPLGQLALVVTANNSTIEDKDSLARRIVIITKLVAFFIIGAITFFYPWMGLFLKIWIGSSEIAIGVASYLEYILWGILPYAVFLGLRGIIEAIKNKPYNLVTLIVSNASMCLSFFFFSFFFERDVAIKISVTLSMGIMGVLTIYWLKEFLHIGPFIGFLKLLPAFIIVLLVGSLLSYFQSVVSFLLSLIITLVVFCPIIMYSSDESIVFLRNTFKRQIYD